MKATFFIFLVLLSIYYTVASFQCDPKVKYIENNCNECSCNPQIGLVCGTSKLIANCQNYHQLRHCTTGSSNSCNTCWCVDNYGTVCTNKKC
ncbi:hypothetical protein RN001_015501 [Aquatica leii]|uniref:Protease inhibitor n=1 Tax=Aquatica leii TaxID=1421715 RepID=A0AAN7PQW4_9COLE|nr:hypothetical protein RN001_015501 [Aquatica leii]